MKVLLNLFSHALIASAVFFGLASSAQAKDCPNFSIFHDLLPEVNGQLATRNKVKSPNGPLKPRKVGYGFMFKETPIAGFSCKTNTLFIDEKIIANCSRETKSKAESRKLYDHYFDCFIDQGWGQRSIYLIDPFDDRTEAKLYAFDKTFSLEFVQHK